MATKRLGMGAGYRQRRDDGAEPRPGEALAGPIPWQAAGPVGGEIRVNSFTTGTQNNPAIAVLGNGTFVVAWTSSGQDGSGDGVYAQRFAANGTPAGAEFRVATTTADDQRAPALTALSGGGFVITWETRVGGTAGYDVLGQRYDAAGAAQGGEFLVNQTTASYQGKSTVAAFSGGGFVAAWQSIVGESTEIFARRFNADGSPAGAEFRVNSFTTGEQEEAAVAVLAGGGFIVTWQSDGQDGSGRGIYGQLYTAAGAPVGTEFRANTTTANAQSLPSVTALEGGGFVIVWGGAAVRGQMYAANGTPVGSEIVIATGFNGVSVTALAGGGFAVSWDEVGTAGGGDGAGFSVVARAFNASGQALGEVALINETTAGDQRTAGGHGTIGQLADGSVAVVWAGNGTGDSSGVFVRRYELGGDIAGPAPIIGTSGVDTLTGTAGDDVIRGLGGNDTIDGLGGTDVAEYLGARANYRVTFSGGVYTVDDQREGAPDGSDRLTNVEFLRFSDGEVAIGDAVVSPTPPGATPSAGPVLINATPEPSAIFPMTVALSGGGYAVVWLGDFAVQNNPATLRGRAFNAAGQPVGDEFTVGDMDFLSEEQVPSLTALAGGGFAVTWMSPSNDIFDQYQDLQIQLYNAVGAAGPRINAGSTGRFSTPVLVGTANGGFLLIRDPEEGTGEFSTVGQFFSSAGTATGGPFAVGVNVGDHVSAAILTNGDIVMAWNEYAQSAGERAFVRLFSPTGQPRGDSFVVDPAQPAGHNVPSVAALAGGGFVMTWFHNNPDNDVYARVFDADGDPVSATFTVNENTAGTQWYGYVEALDDGGFVISWTGNDGDSDGVFARIFDASGQPRGGEFIINEGIVGNQEAEIRNLAQLANGDLVFSFTGPGADGTNGVYTRRFVLEDSSGPIVGTPGPDALDGTAGADVIQGLGGNDLLDGKGGADRLEGGTGDDGFVVDQAGDVVIELAGEGNDRVFASASFTLVAGLSVETLSTDWNAGTGAIDLTGNALANLVIGNAGANVLTGGAGDDVLDGKEGNDTLYGGADNDNLYGRDGNDQLFGGAGTNYLAGGTGDDLYFVDNAGDQIVELAGQGNDRIYASLSYSLRAGVSVEILSTDFNAGTSAINLTGNELVNTLYGNAGANILSGGGGNDLLEGRDGNDQLHGGAGADMLVGGLGDDLYFIDNAGDTVMELAGQGADRILTSVSYTLAAGVSVDVMSTDWNAGTGALNLTGNELVNTLFGNEGANILNGGGGGDFLEGKGGADTYQFTTGLGANNVDIVSGFQSGVDRFALDDAIFTQLNSPGALNLNAFHTGAAAADANDRIVYNSATGQLFYDADGSGAGVAILFATLQGNPALAASDFMVI